MGEAIPLPQRFQWKADWHSEWQNGVCIPAMCGGIRYWWIRAGAGHGSFDHDPWEMLPQILGDVQCFRWIDDDYDWWPRGGECCGIAFESASQLREHLVSRHKLT